MNIVVLVGSLARPPLPRTLPSGDVVVGFEVTVRPPEGRPETVPVVWPGAPPSALTIPVGEEVVVTGRVQRRFFRTGGATASRTEVLAGGLVPTRHLRRARRLVDAAAAELVAADAAPDAGAAPVAAPDAPA